MNGKVMPEVLGGGGHGQQMDPTAGPLSGFAFSIEWLCTALFYNLFQPFCKLIIFSLVIASDLDYHALLIFHEQATERSVCQILFIPDLSSGFAVDYYGEAAIFLLKSRASLTVMLNTPWSRDPAQLGPLLL